MKEYKVNERLTVKAEYNHAWGLVRSFSLKLSSCCGKRHVRLNSSKADMRTTSFVFAYLELKCPLE